MPAPKLRPLCQNNHQALVMTRIRDRPRLHHGGGSGVRTREPLSGMPLKNASPLVAPYSYTLHQKSPRLELRSHAVVEGVGDHGAST